MVSDFLYGHVLIFCRYLALRTPLGQQLLVNAVRPVSDHMCVTSEFSSWILFDSDIVFLRKQLSLHLNSVNQILCLFSLGSCLNIVL